LKCTQNLSLVKTRAIYRIYYKVLGYVNLCSHFKSIVYDTTTKAQQCQSQGRIGNAFLSNFELQTSIFDLIFRTINKVNFCSDFIHQIYTFKIFCHRAQKQT